MTDLKQLTHDLATRAQAIYGADFLAAHIGYNVHPGCGEMWKSHICLIGRSSHHVDGDTPEQCATNTFAVMQADSVEALSAVLGIPVEFAAA